MALVIGSLISSPVMVSNVRTLSVLSFRIGSCPSVDTELQIWINNQKHVCTVTTNRDRAIADQAVLTVRIEANHFKPVVSTIDVANKMRSLGYSIAAIEDEKFSMANRIEDFFSDPRMLATLIGGTQLSFLIMGWIAIRSSNYKSAARSTIESRRQSIVLGFSVGLGLLVIGEVYSEFIRLLRGCHPPSPWDAASTLPTTSRLMLVFMGGVFAPVAEEVFFRGYILRKYMEAGFIWRGGLVCSLFFAMVHVTDPFHVPCIFLFGAILSWLYIKTNSLIAPVIAHAANNVLALVVLALT